MSDEKFYSKSNKENCFKKCRAVLEKIKSGEYKNAQEEKTAFKSEYQQVLYELLML